MTDRGETGPGFVAILRTVTRLFVVPFPALLVALLVGTPAVYAQTEFDAGRRPYQIIREDAAQIRALYAARIEIDSMSSEGVRVWVDSSRLEWLKSRGWTVRPLSLPAYSPPPPGEKGPPLAYPLAVYPTYDQITAALQGFAADYPDLCRLVSVGASVQGRDLWFLKITDNPDVEEQEPEHKYVSTMHGNEPVGTVLMLNLIHRLLTEYPTSDRIQSLVDSTEIWIMPLMNPDGYQIRSRYNARGEDLNRDFPDRVDDPNPSPNGREPETQALMAFAAARSSVLSANFHTGSLVVNYPNDNSEFRFVFNHPDWFSPDDDFFVAQSLAYSTPNGPMYNNPEFPQGITNGISWYPLSGGMQDWNYHFMGCNEVTIELSNTFQPNAATLPTVWGNNEESLVAYMEMIHRGVKGRVTDARSGGPLAARVSVVGRDHAVHTDPDVGDYYRLLLPGTYDLEFTAPGYGPRLFAGVVVVDSTPTRLDVVLDPLASRILFR